jgi:mercuric reductase
MNENHDISEEYLHDKNNPITQIELDVRGMTCDSCALHVTNTLKSVSGVGNAAIPGWESGKATVFASPELNLDALTAAVAKAGYSASVRETNSLSVEPEIKFTLQEVQDFDLMIIGGGSAGSAAAIKASELGFSVGIVNAGQLAAPASHRLRASKTLIRAMSLSQAGLNRFRGVQTLVGISIGQGDRS